MTPLGARQWPVLRRAPAALSALCRVQRSYTKRTPNKSEKRLTPLDASIVIPTSVSAQPERLLHTVQPLPNKKASRQRFCVFFVTPSFAPWLLDDEAFLYQALRRLYMNLLEKPNWKIHALCAVVDKLPVTRPFAEELSFEDDISRRNTEPPPAGTGLEGMAYAVLPERASLPSNGPPRSDSGSVDFVLKEHVVGDEVLRDTLRLPLANTVFQTGTPTTMTLSTWRTVAAPNSLNLVSKKNVSHHSIRLVDQTKKLQSALNIPLLPLTVPRAVQGCMGNIIRRVTGSDGESVQASAELERVVPRFFRSRRQPAQATTAWALVIPAELKETINMRTEELLSGLADDDWERLWRSNPPAWSTLVSTALAEGARLHRVLSGGGGWGQKAGLLSLDPVPASEVDDPLESGDIPRMISDPEDFASTLTPVVRDGDSIQFFILPKSDLAEDAAKFDPYKKLPELIRPKHEGQSLGWELGMIPSTMDSIPGESWQHVNKENDQVYHIWGGFGALTEGGMTLTRHVKGSGDEAGLVPNITTVDVPFSRLWAAEERTRDEDSPEPPRKHLNRLSWKEKQAIRRERRFATTPPRRIRRIPWLDKDPVVRTHVARFSTMRPKSGGTNASAVKVVDNPLSSKEALDRYSEIVKRVGKLRVQYDQTKREIYRSKTRRTSSTRRNPPEMNVLELAAAPRLTNKRMGIQRMGRTYMNSRLARAMLNVLSRRGVELRLQFTNIMTALGKGKNGKGKLTGNDHLGNKIIRKIVHESSKSTETITHTINLRSSGKPKEIRRVRSDRKDGGDGYSVRDGTAMNRPKETTRSPMQDPEAPIRTFTSGSARIPIRKFISVSLQDPVSLSARQRLNTIVLDISCLTEEAKLIMRDISQRMLSSAKAVQVQQLTFDTISNTSFVQPGKPSTHALASRIPLLDHKLKVWRARMRKSKIKMDFLKEEYKVIISAVLRRQQQASPQQLLRLKLESRIAQITDRANTLTKRNAQFLDTSQTELAQIRSARHLQNLDDPLIRQVHDMETALQIIHTDLQKTLYFVTLTAHLTHKVNQSGHLVYKTHVALRQRLIKMIQTRRKANFQPLATRLEVLRDFTDVLLLNRPGLRRSDVRAHLEAMEQAGVAQKRSAKYLTSERIAEETKRKRREHQYFGPLIRTHVVGSENDEDRSKTSGPLIRTHFVGSESDGGKSKPSERVAEETKRKRRERQSSSPLIKTYFVGSESDEGRSKASDGYAARIKQRIQTRFRNQAAAHVVDSEYAKKLRSSPTVIISRRSRSLTRRIPLLEIRTHGSLHKTQGLRGKFWQDRGMVRKLPTSPRKRRERMSKLRMKEAFIETVGGWLNG